jgi:hypothetical protein
MSIRHCNFCNCLVRDPLFGSRKLLLACVALVAAVVLGLIVNQVKIRRLGVEHPGAAETANGFHVD